MLADILSCMQPAASTPSKGRKPRILIVSADQEMRQFLSSMISLRGIDCEAIDFFEMGKDGNLTDAPEYRLFHPDATQPPIDGIIIHDASKPAYDEPATEKRAASIGETVDNKLQLYLENNPGISPEEKLAAKRRITSELERQLGAPLSEIREAGMGFLLNNPPSRRGAELYSKLKTTGSPYLNTPTVVLGLYPGRSAEFDAEPAHNARIVEDVLFTFTGDQLQMSAVQALIQSVRDNTPLSSPDERRVR